VPARHGPSVRRLGSVVPVIVALPPFVLTIVRHR